MTSSRWPSGWDIDILTPNEFNASLDTLEKTLRDVEGVDSQMIDKIVAMGMVSVMDVEEVGADPLVEELGVERLLGQRIASRCAQEARKVAETQGSGRGERSTQAAAASSQAAAASSQAAGQAAPASEGETPAAQAASDEPAGGPAAPE
jgi:N utilization substance protein A